MPTLTLTKADDNRSFNVQKGDQVIIWLEESPATGYRWAVEPIGQDILVLQATEFAPTGGGIGGGGERTFTFVANATGVTQLNFKLWRDWEGESSVRNRFNASITVK
jgi:inhibitor of cysteine peptidase